MICPNCERYKASASMWRNKAYEASGHPLPWKPDELWVGLTKREFQEAVDGLEDLEDCWVAIEAKLRSKNT